MNQTTLQFPSIIEMHDFKAVVNATTIYLNTTTLTLTADFTEADIELAKEGFGAVLVDASKIDS